VLSSVSTALVVAPVVVASVDPSVAPTGPVGSTGPVVCDPAEVLLSAPLSVTPVVGASVVPPVAGSSVVCAVLVVADWPVELALALSSKPGLRTIRHALVAAASSAGPTTCEDTGTSARISEAAQVRHARQPRSCARLRCERADHGVDAKIGAAASVAADSADRETFPRALARGAAR